MTHTPGPWEYGGYLIPCEDDDGEESYASVMADITERDEDGAPEEGTVICHCYGAGPSEVEAIANACLIAAAPELLEALRNCIAELIDIEDGNESLSCVEEARAAIAKAEGK